MCNHLYPRASRFYTLVAWDFSYEDSISCQLMSQQHQIYEPVTADIFGHFDLSSSPWNHASHVLVISSSQKTTVKPRKRSKQKGSNITNMFSKLDCDFIGGSVPTWWHYTGGWGIFPRPPPCLQPCSIFPWRPSKTHKFDRRRPHFTGKWIGYSADWVRCWQSRK